MKLGDEIVDRDPCELRLVTVVELFSAGLIAFAGLVLKNYGGAK